MNDKIRHISDQADKNKSSSLESAIMRAKQHIRNRTPDGLDEPEGFASGDMKKHLDEYDKGEDEADGKNEV